MRVVTKMHRDNQARKIERYLSSKKHWNILKDQYLPQTCLLIWCLLRIEGHLEDRIYIYLCVCQICQNLSQWLLSAFLIISTYSPPAILQPTKVSRPGAIHIQLHRWGFAFGLQFLCLSGQLSWGTKGMHQVGQLTCWFPGFLSSINPWSSFWKWS